MNGLVRQSFQLLCLLGIIVAVHILHLLKHFYIHVNGTEGCTVTRRMCFSAEEVVLIYCFVCC